jgi:prophage maintenance system killer protein
MYKNKIIRANAAFGEKVKSESSLDHASERATYEKSRFKKLALLVRAIVVDHTFTDANKRTALVTISSELSEDYKINRKRLVIVLRNIAERNINDLDQISRRIRKCTKPIKKNLK